MRNGSSRVWRRVNAGSRWSPSQSRVGAIARWCKAKCSSGLMTLKAVIHEDESGGYWAEVPSLPGCVTQGESMSELEENIREAIAAWLEAAEPGPSPVGDCQILEVAV